MSTKIIGQPVDRVDGRAKVTGRARYAADNPVPGFVHGYGVFSTIGAGRITAIDATAATKLPGVLGVWHHGNAPKLFRSPNRQDTDRVGEVRTPFEDDRVYYAGQFVAVVVAETFEQARAAARLVRVSYREEKPVVSLEAAMAAHGTRAPRDESDSQRGEPARAWESAEVKIDATYSTPTEVHNPMELHGAIAAWNGERLEVHDSTQWVVGQRNALAQVFGIPLEHVTVRSAYIGGGFGGKLFLWPHTIVAALAAREVGRPVKLVLERRQEFTTVGHRPPTRQRMRFGATKDGRLVSVRHDSISPTSQVDEFVESCGGTTRVLYSCPNLAISYQTTSANIGTPTPMRAPGAAPGTFALECAMDELALALGLDPVAFRLRNYAEKDEAKDLPWSSNHLRECYSIASERFGWKQRQPAPGSMRDGEEILGWGMAAACWPGDRDKAAARVQLRADGTACVSCATQDIGTGTYTVIAQVAAEITGLPLAKIEVQLGDSSFPEGPISGGSQVTATVVPAVAEASRQAINNLLRVARQPGAPFAGLEAKALSLRDGAVVSAEGDKRATIADVLAAARLASIDGEAKTAPGDESKKYSFRCFGAHFVEVRWDPGIARLRVARVVTAIDAGRIINRKTATNQVLGSIVMGLGMTLFEQSIYDPRTGRVVTDNVADYLMPLNSDAPVMDVVLLDHPDPHVGEFGARGIGEIGITGIAAAVVNAIYHATGKRIRDLPVLTEKLLA